MLGFEALPGFLGVLASAYLALCLALGHALRARLLPPAPALFEGAAGVRTADGPDLEGRPLRPTPHLPAWTFDVPVALVLGGIVLTSAVYLLACAFDAVLPATSAIHPLLPANLAGAALAVLAIRALRPPHRQVPLAEVGRGPVARAVAGGTDAVRRAWAAFVSSPFFAGSAVAFLLVGTYIMAYVFWMKDGVLHSGVTAFSDFSPHTAMIRSFSHGRNFPTEYPHFANDGIRYHFLFLFLTGNLEFLGLRMDLAFDLLGILGLAAFCVLLGALGVALTGRRGVFLLGPLLLFLRASVSFVPFLAELARKADGSPVAFAKLLFAQRDFIGDTPFDNWGIWTFNVFGNQRHLLWGGVAMLLVLFIFLPYLHRMTVRLRALRRPGRGGADAARQLTTDDLLRTAEAVADAWSDSAPECTGPDDASSAPATAPAAARRPAPAPGLRAFFLSREAWIPDRADLPAIGLAAGLLFLLPYWHGSVLLSALAVLFVLAIVSQARLAHLAVAVAALAGSWLQTGFFAGFGTSVVSPSFYFGFVAPLRSVFGVLDYAFQAFGLTFVLLLLLFFSLRRTQAFALAAFAAPFALAFTVSFLPEGLRGMTSYYILVNHKFIVLTFALANLFIAGMLCDLWAAGRERAASFSYRTSAAPDAMPDEASPPDAAHREGAGEPPDAAPPVEAPVLPRLRAPSFPGLWQRVLAVALGFALMANGAIDAIIYFNRDRQTVGIDTRSPLVLWIEAHAAPDAVFLTPPDYAYNAFFLSGRLSFYAWPYFATSAGHDTGDRIQVVDALYAGCGGDLAEFRRLAEENGIAFAIVDDGLRNNADRTTDEAFFEKYLPVAASFPELGNLVVYDLRADPLALP